jgi:hypothetical protein
LISLEGVLESRVIPYLDNMAGLEALEASRPEFFELRDLRLNRPMPNHVLHESAHAVAYDALIGERDVREALRDPAHLAHLIAGEAFAMTAEYLAACAVTGKTHAWLFSVNSYRHRVPGRKAVGELIEQFGPEPVTWAIFAAFLYNNFFTEKVSRRQLDAILGLYAMTAPIARDSASKNRLRAALGSLMQMDPEFRTDTSRLFLSTLGYGRGIRDLLDFDPIDAIGRDPNLQAGLLRLVAVVTGDAPERRLDIAI